LNTGFSLLPFFAEHFMIDVLDVGAALNETPPYARLVEAGRARLMGFEADPGECESLNREYGAPHRFFPHFAGDGKPATFHETNWVLTGSLYEPNSPLLEKFQNLAELTTPVARHPVPTTRIDDIADIDNVDFIKIDVQGAELAVLSNATRALASALVVQVEVEFVEMYKGQPLFGDVDALMRRNGFQFHTFPGFGMRAFKPIIMRGDPNAAVRQMLWSDAIYVRDWMRLEELSDLRLSKFAVLVHDVFGSWDLAHLLLAELDRRNGTSLAGDYLKRLGVP
jgi:FkbM family methyltransferase